MSPTHQEEFFAEPEHTDVVGTPPVARPSRATDSSPVKRKHGPNQAFTVEPCNFEEVRKQFNIEMRGHWWGPMPVELFLQTLVPATDVPLPDIPQDPFQDVPQDGTETARYNTFISAIRDWIPHLRAVNTGNKEDTVNGVKLKTDITVYNLIDGVAAPRRTNFSQMELWVEFKANVKGHAFQDPADSSEQARLLAMEKKSFVPDTIEGSTTRGQMAHYAGAQHSMQFRNFSFSILVEDDFVRFLRWDRAGTIVTAAFNYREEPMPMAKFLWRFDHMSPAQRGHDVTVQPADLRPEDAMRVKKRLEIEDGEVVLYRYAIPGQEGKGFAYGPRPPAINRSLASRFTRTTPTVWIPTRATDTHGRVEEGWWNEEGKLMFLKDTWRYLSDSLESEIKPEHEIYEILHKNNTPNIPDLVVGGDVEGGKTRTQEFVKKEWLCVAPEVCPFQHYRLLQGVVGRALVTFDCTKQLVTGVLDAITAHSHAYEVSNLLHRDVSIGNIILTDEGRGLLIDWEMAKDVNEIRRTRPDRTGTWQFMSAKLLENPRRRHTLTDDLESFLHVLGWTTLRYVPAVDSFQPIDRAIGLQQFDEHFPVEGHGDKGGFGKAQVLGRGAYPCPDFEAKHSTPLVDLIVELSMPFKSHYAARPPTAEDREKANSLAASSDKKLDRLRRAINDYDEDLQKLESASFFIDEIQDALDTKDWPTDDKADPNLPIPPLVRMTERQELMWTSQLHDTQRMFGESKGKSSKRAASPTPELRSSKRHRGEAS